MEWDERVHRIKAARRGSRGRAGPRAAQPATIMPMRTGPRARPRRQARHADSDDGGSTRLRAVNGDPDLCGPPASGAQPHDQQPKGRK